VNSCQFIVHGRKLGSRKGRRYGSKEGGREKGPSTEGTQFTEIEGKK
jgi:hypothetical protein